MSHEHSPTAIADQPQGIKCISFRIVSLEKVKVGVPFVSNDLAASEATDGYNHLPRVLPSTRLFLSSLLLRIVCHSRGRLVEAQGSTSVRVYAKLA